MTDPLVLEATLYYLTMAQAFIYPIGAVIFTVLMFHYNGIIIFRWIAVALWSLTAYYLFNVGNNFNILAYKLIAVVAVGGGIVFAVVPTTDKHVDVDEQAGEVGHITGYLERLQGREQKIRAIRSLGRRRVQPAALPAGTVWDTKSERDS